MFQGGLDSGRPGAEYEEVEEEVEEEMEEEVVDSSESEAEPPAEQAVVSFAPFCSFRLM